LPDFTGIQQGFTMITVEGAFWEKKNQKWSRVTHVTTVSLVIAVLTNGVPELKNFKTLRGSIEKIKTLGVKLKIAVNFKRG
jgi:hypothetical protein